MEMIANIVRMIENDQIKEFAFGDDQSLKEKLAIGLIHPDDYKNLYITPSINIKVLSKYGEVVLKAIEDKNITVGIINIPVSIWANQIAGVEDHEPIYKNLTVNIEITRDPILDFKELISKIKTES